jgi:multidrug resistance protein, MATE family
MSKITCARLLHEVKLQLALALPVSWTFLMRRSVDLIAIIYVGHLGKKYLAAAGIATVTANVTGYSQIVGFAGALSTLCGWAKGADDVQGMNLALQRSLIIIPLVICLPVTLLWVYSEEVMVLFGQQPEIAELAQHYLFYSIPGLWARAVAVCVQNFLHAQQYMAGIAYSVTIAAIFNIFFCWLFVVHLNMGFAGAAIAMTACRVLEALLLSLYLVGSGCFHQTAILQDFAWSLECFQNWGPFFRLAMPNLLMIAEWWASEILIFMSGLLAIDPQLQVATMSVYQNLIAICFMFPSCLRVSATTRISNELGANNPTKAKVSCFVAVALALAIGGAVAAVLLSHPSYWATIFTNDESVQSQVTSLVPLLAIYVVVDGAQTALTGAIMGTGNQVLGGVIVLVSYYAVGIPTAYVLGFNSPKYYTFNMGVEGLCLGTLAATCVHFLLYVVVTSCFTDWKFEANKAVSRLREQGQSQTAALPQGAVLNTTYAPIRNSEHPNDRSRAPPAARDSEHGGRDSPSAMSFSSGNGGSFRGIVLSDDEDSDEEGDEVEDWDFGLDNLQYDPTTDAGAAPGALTRGYYYLADLLFNTNYSEKLAHSQQYELVKSHVSTITDSMRYRNMNVSTSISDDGEEEEEEDDYDGLI